MGACGQKMNMSFTMTDMKFSVLTVHGQTIRWQTERANSPRRLFCPITLWIPTGMESRNLSSIRLIL